MCRVSVSSLLCKFCTLKITFASLEIFKSDQTKMERVKQIYIDLKDFFLPVEEPGNILNPFLKMCVFCLPSFLASCSILGQMLAGWFSALTHVSSGSRQLCLPIQSCIVNPLCTDCSAPNGWQTKLAGEETETPGSWRFRYFSPELVETKNTVTERAQDVDKFLTTEENTEKCCVCSSFVYLLVVFLSRSVSSLLSQKRAQSEASIGLER